MCVKIGDLKQGKQVVVLAGVSVRAKVKGTEPQTKLSSYTPIWPWPIQIPASVAGRCEAPLPSAEVALLRMPKLGRFYPFFFSFFFEDTLFERF